MILSLLLAATLATTIDHPKTLTPEAAEAYLSGDGMGLAKAAELNHYPGPKHVLELRSELALSTEQLEKTTRIHAEMKEAAVRLGREILDAEKRLDRMFADGEADEKRLSDLTGEIARLQGQLRAVHLRAHLQMKSVLSPEQVERYDRLRGHAKHEGAAQHHH